MLGNHIDAWIFGAVDPSSGTAAMMELTRVFLQLHNETGISHWCHSYEYVLDKALMCTLVMRSDGIPRQRVCLKADRY